MDTTEMLTTAALLRRGMGWGPLDAPPQPCNAHCALTGAPITQGYTVDFALPATTGNRLDILRSASDWLCADVAVCYKNDWNLGARLIFEDGTMFYPLIDRKEAARQGRPAWRDLVRSELPQRVGQRHLCLLNTDSKKRTWPIACVSVVGENMRWHVNDGKYFGVFANLRLDLGRLLATLTLVEEVYRHYPKSVIQRGLWSVQPPAGVSWAQMHQWENALRAVRNAPEFVVSIIIAQKEE